jgi:hypothetical protein
MADITLSAPVGEPIEVVELDKSGNIQRKWLHGPNNVVVPVSISGVVVLSSPQASRKLGPR